MEFNFTPLSKPSSFGPADTPVKRLSKADVTVFELVLLTCFNFPYGLICGTFGLWILPSEAKSLFPEYQSLTLGISLMIVGLSQLVCPVAGALSDVRCCSTRFAKRWPFLLWGSVLAALSTFGMLETSICRIGVLYYFCVFSGMTSLNVVYAIQYGLVPDFLDESVESHVSGIVAVHALLGSATGFALAITTYNRDFRFVYPLAIIAVGLSTFLCVTTSIRLERRLEGMIAERRERKTEGLMRLARTAAR